MYPKGTSNLQSPCLSNFSTRITVVYHQMYLNIFSLLGCLVPKVIVALSQHLKCIAVINFMYIHSLWYDLPCILDYSSYIFMLQIILAYRRNFLIECYLNIKISHLNADCQLYVLIFNEFVMYCYVLCIKKATWAFCKQCLPFIQMSVPL